MNSRHKVGGRRRQRKQPYERHVTKTMNRITEHVMNFCELQPQDPPGGGISVHVYFLNANKRKEIVIRPGSILNPSTPWQNGKIRKQFSASVTEAEPALGESPLKQAKKKADPYRLSPIHLTTQVLLPCNLGKNSICKTSS